MTTIKPLLLVSIGLILSAPLSLQAEVVRLKSGEIIHGEIEHAYGGVFTIRTPKGGLRSVGRNEIAAIEFAPLPKLSAPAKGTSSSKAEAKTKKKHFLTGLTPPPASKYATPQQTFATWRKAAEMGRAGRLKIEAAFSADRMGQDYQKQYDLLMREKK